MIRSSSLIVALGVFTAVVVTGCRRDPQVLKQQFEAAGDGYAQAKNDTAAVVEYRNALQADPNAGEIHYKLALAWIRLGEISKSLPELLRAADLLPADDEVQLLTARTLLIAGRSQEARTRLEAILAKAPENAGARVLLGNALAGLRDPDAALQQIEEATRLAPEDPTAFVKSGTLRVSQGDRDAAEQAFNTAIALAPTSPYPHLSLAQFYWLGNDTAKARPEIEKALELGKRDPLVNRFAGSFYQAIGRADLAEQVLFTAADADTTPGGRLALARFYLSRAKWQDASAQLQPLTSDPTVGANASRLLAKALLSQGKATEAEAIIDRLLAKDGEQAETLTVKAAILFAQAKSDDALRTINGALRRQPESIEAQLLKGKILVAANRSEEAKEAFGQVLKINPRAVGARIELAKLFLAAGAADGVVSMANAALKIDSAEIEAQLLLVKGLMGQKQFNVAQDAIEKALKSAPRSAALNATAGTVQAMQGNARAAARAWKVALELDPMQLEAVAGLAALDLAEGHREQALGRVDRLAEGHPERPELLVLAARTHLLAGDAKNAETLLIKAVDKDPTLLSAFNLLGQIYVRQNRIEEALTEFQRLAKAQPRPVAALTVIGMLEQALGRPDDAVVTFERVIALDSRAAIAANNLAWIYAEQGTNLDRALELATTAKEVIPGQASIDDTLGWVYLKKSMPSQAVTALERAQRRDPANPAYQYHLGIAYAQNGQPDQAKSFLAQALKAGEGTPYAADAARRLAEM